jgi:hypothetical protein
MVNYSKARISLAQEFLLFLLKEKVTKSSSEFDGNIPTPEDFLLPTRVWESFKIEGCKVQSLRFVLRDIS